MDNRDRFKFDDFIRKFNGTEEKIHMTMSNMKKCFEGAKDKNKKYIGVKIVTPASSEVVIVASSDFDAKLAYYEGAYNEELSLFRNKKVYIEGFTYANDFNSIQRDLI